MCSESFAIYSATVFTGNPGKPWAQAVGIKDGRIAAVGTNQDVRNAMPWATALELPGRLVSAGLTDAHCHFIHFGQSLQIVDLRKLTSIDACRDRIRQAGAEARPGEWILGRNWNHHGWVDGREPDRHDLDDILPDNPAMMIRVCGHSQWLNTCGLKAAGITRGTAAPPGVRFERDESGEPTGLLREARRFVMASVPPSTREELKTAALAAQAQALKVGLTRVHTYETLPEWDALSDLDREGKLKLRVHHLIYTDDLNDAVERGLTPGYGSDRLWAGHVKLYADGSLGAKTALMNDPYCDDPGNCGIPFFDLDKLSQKVSEAYQHRFPVAIHAIGDKAVSNSLDAIARARKEESIILRDSVEHIQLCQPRDLERFKEMGVTASVQPVFLPTDYPVAERQWGLERCRYSYQWKTIMDMAIRTQFGSDAPVEPIAPILGLQAAVLRQTTAMNPPGGWFPEQRLSLEQGLSGFTRVAAWTASKEHLTGRLERGMWADLTVFERDLTVVPPKEWAEINVEMTIVDGEVVYRKEKG